VAFKVGALSYGGGFVIIPLMQHDVVSVYHWMTGVQFLNVVALGQITPGPVVLTTAAVGYAVHGVVGSLLATLVAFGPSFIFIMGGARHFERLRQNDTAKAFLAGAAPSVIGAIAGSTVPLALLLAHLWQLPLLAAAALWLSMVGANAGDTSWSTTTVTTTTTTTTTKTTGAAGGYVVSTTSVPPNGYSTSANSGYISSPQTTYSQAYLQPFIYLPAPVPHRGRHLVRHRCHHRAGGGGRRSRHPGGADRIGELRHHLDHRHARRQLSCGPTTASAASSSLGAAAPDRT
jgi:chromate transport protein ChrA